MSDNSAEVLKESVLQQLRAATRDWEGDFAFTAEPDLSCECEESDPHMEFDVTVRHEGLRVSHRMVVRIDDFYDCELCMDGEDCWMSLTAESLFCFMWFDLASQGA